MFYYTLMEQNKYSKDLFFFIFQFWEEQSETERWLLMMTA